MGSKLDSLLAQVGLCEGVFDTCPENTRVYWFDKIVLYSQAKGVGGNLFRAVGGDQNCRDVVALGRQLAQDIQACRVRQFQIKQNKGRLR